MSKYVSPFSVANRQPLYINSNDPRVSTPGKLAQTIARSGREIKIVNSNNSKMALEPFDPNNPPYWFLSKSIQTRNVYSGSANCNVDVNSTNDIKLFVDSPMSGNFEDIQVFDKNGNRQYGLQVFPDNQYMFSSLSKNTIDSQNNFFIAIREPDLVINTSNKLIDIVAKYNKNNQLIWAKKFNQSLGGFSITSLTLDSSDNLFVLATQAYGTHLVSVLIKINSSGTIQWKTTLSTTSSSVYTLDMATDSSSNSFIHLTNQSGKDYIVKINSSGSLVWKKMFTVATQYVSSKKSIYIDNSNNIYAIFNVGGFYGNASKSILLKLDQSGNTLNKKTFNFFGSIYDIVFDTNNDMYMCGNETNSGSLVANIFKTSSSFNVVWHNILSSNYSFNISLKDNDIFLDGMGGSGYSVNNMFLTKIPNSGACESTGTYTVSSYSSSPTNSSSSEILEYTGTETYPLLVASSSTAFLSSITDSTLYLFTDTLYNDISKTKIWV